MIGLVVALEFPQGGWELAALPADLRYVCLATYFYAQSPY